MAPLTCNYSHTWADSAPVAICPWVLLWEPGEEEDKAEPKDQYCLIKHLSHLRFLYSLKPNVGVSGQSGFYLLTRRSGKLLQTQRDQGHLEVQIAQECLPSILIPTPGSHSFIGPELAEEACPSWELHLLQRSADLPDHHSPQLFCPPAASNKGKVSFRVSKEALWPSCFAWRWVMILLGLSLSLLRHHFAPS